MAHSSGWNCQTCRWSVLLAGLVAASQIYRGLECQCCQLTEHCDVDLVSISGCQMREQMETFIIHECEQNCCLLILWFRFLLHPRSYLHGCVLSYSKPSVQLRASKEVASEVRGHWGRVRGLKDCLSPWMREKCDHCWVLSPPATVLSPVWIWRTCSAFS